MQASSKIAFLIPICMHTNCRVHELNRPSQKQKIPPECEQQLPFSSSGMQSGVSEQSEQHCHFPCNL